MTTETHKEYGDALEHGQIIKLYTISPDGPSQYAMVLSAPEVLRLTGVALAVPIATKTDEYPTHIDLQTVNDSLTGKAMCQYVRSLDLNLRKYEVIDEATSETLAECRRVVAAMIHA